MAEHVAGLSGVTLLNRVRYREFSQNEDGVLITVEDAETGAPRTLRARFLVGCDGARSEVRKQIGAKLSGTEVIQRVQSTCIRSPQLVALLPGERAWGYYSVNTRRCGTVFNIDGHGTYLVHNHLNHGEGDFDSIDRDASIRTILGVGDDFEYEVVSKEDWTGRRLVADRLRAGRVFICGDAAHLWVPYAGYGMNAGIADAFNLSWVLAAVLDGWADPGILDVYQAERQPITEQVSRLAMEHALKMIAARGAVPEGLGDAGPGGGRPARRDRPLLLRPQRAPVRRRRPELRVLLRGLPGHCLRRRGTSRLHHGLVHAVQRPGLSGTALLAARRPVNLRRVRPGLHAAALRPAR